MIERRSRRLPRFVPVVALLVTCCYGLLLTTGCKRGSDASSSNKLKVAYLGLT